MNTLLSANRSVSGESRSQHSDNQGSGSELTLPAPLRGYADNSDDEGVWARKTVLSFGMLRVPFQTSSRLLLIRFMSFPQTVGAFEDTQAY